MNRFSRRTLLKGSATAIGLGVGSGLVPGVGRWTAAQTPVPISLTALDDLRARLNGTLMLPGDTGYPFASAPANGRYLDIKPAAIARVADEADVVTCVNWCTENGIAPVVRGGGHSYAGYSTTTGLLVDIRRLNSVTIDKHEGTVVCGGAALNGDFLTASENGAFFLPGGTCLGVGVGGLTLGGGIGYNTHWAGLTCDHLLSSRIVTASGDLLDIDDTQNNDLFWACRGGAGGSFGINTQFKFSLVEVPQGTVAWYRYEWQGADAAEAVLSAFDTMMQTAPPALNAVAMAQATPIGSDGPRAAIQVMSRGQYIGPLDELDDLIRPLQSIPGRTRDDFFDQPFWQTIRTVVTGEPEPHSYGDISRYADAPIPQDVISDMVDNLADCPSRSADDNGPNGAIWSIGWVGGDVVNAVSRTETAYVHRNATTLYRPTTVWPNDARPSVGDELNAWTDQIIATLDPYTPQESYQNFPNRSIQNWQEQYYAENYERLVDVKTKFDPGNLFHHPQSIPPRS